MSKIAVASSSYEHKVSGIRITKKFAAQSFALERVADGRLVIPREGVRIVCVLLLYAYVVAVEVCFRAVHTLNEDVHNAQVRILSRAF